MKSFVKRLLRRGAYRLGYHNVDHLSFLLNTRLQKTDDFFLIQIGANDGRTYDPIHDFIVANRTRVRGLLIEPVSDFHAQLVETYRGCPGIQTAQVAIHASEKTMQLYRVAPERLEMMPDFVKGIASFDKTYHTKSDTPPDAIIAETVNCITMSELLARYGVNKIDLLCIDTEGYDSEIVLSLDLDSIRPVILSFEHGLRHDVMTDEAFMKIVRRLNRYNYDVMVLDYDVVAHLRDELAH